MKKKTPTRLSDFTKPFIYYKTLETATIAYSIAEPTITNGSKAAGIKIKCSYAFVLGPVHLPV